MNTLETIRLQVQTRIDELDDEPAQLVVLLDALTPDAAPAPELKVVRRRRRPPRPANDTEVRDWAQRHGDWFHVTEAAREVDGSRDAVSRVITRLVKAGTLERRGPARGPGVMYRFVKPEPMPGPHSRPRGERMLPAGPGPKVGDLARATGVPVPHARRGGTALAVGTKARWQR
mgnify:CR=1 FL=1